MPSSFKRRVPASAAATPAPTAAPASGTSEASTSRSGSAELGARASAPRVPPKLPPGVKNPLFSSPVPVLSTGVAALDDVLSGSGLSSGAVLLLVPSTGTNPLPPGLTGAAPAPEALDALALAAAEPYNELVLQYGIAQGIHAQHINIIVGEQAEAFTAATMARIGEEEDLQGDTAPAAQLASMSIGNAAAAQDDDSQESAAGPSSAPDEQLKIAFRYDKMSRFSTSVTSHRQQQQEENKQKAEEESRFCATFDLSKRISPRALEKARARDELHFVDVAQLDAADGYQSALDAVEAIIKRVTSADRETTPVIRISVRALGSHAWMRRRRRNGARSSLADEATAMLRFILRLRIMVRSLALPPRPSGAQAAPAAVPAIASVSLSTSFLTLLPIHTDSDGGRLIHTLHRLIHLSDAALSFSSFAASPLLTASFPDYTGSLKVIKTPSIGTLHDLSVRASILRGMSSLGVGQQQQGSRGGQEALAAGGAGGGENNLAFKLKRKRIVIETLHLDVEGGVSERRTKPPRNLDATEPAKSSAVKRPVDTPSAASSRPQPSPQKAPAPASGAPPAAKPAFAGLKSLRERGMQAQRQRPSADHLEIDGGSSESTPVRHAPKPPPVFRSAPADLEF